MTSLKRDWRNGGGVFLGLQYHFPITVVADYEPEKWEKWEQRSIKIGLLAGSTWTMTTRTEIQALTDEELRIRVAELDGWRRNAAADFDVWVRDGEGGFQLHLPDYPHDLNAVREVEKKMDGPEAWEYGKVLASLVRADEDAYVGNMVGGFPLNDLGYYALATLTARRRCQALLLTCKENPD